MNAYEALIKLVTEDVKNRLIDNHYIETVEPSILVCEASKHTIDLCEYKIAMRSASLDVLAGTALRLLGYEIEQTQHFYRIVKEGVLICESEHTNNKLPLPALTNEWVLKDHDESEILLLLNMFKTG